GTVLPEELAFRGLLLALLGRRYGVLGGLLLHSGVFGRWHVVPSLGGGPANTTIASVVGADAAGMLVDHHEPRRPTHPRQASHLGGRLPARQHPLDLLEPAGR